MDFRRRVVAAVKEGETMNAVAKRFKIAQPTVRDWCDRDREGRLEPNKTGPSGPRVLSEADHQLIREQVAARPRITARELVPMLSVPVAQSTVYRHLKLLDLR